MTARRGDITYAQSQFARQRGKNEICADWPSPSINGVAAIASLSTSAGQRRIIRPRDMFKLI